MKCKSYSIIKIIKIDPKYNINNIYKTKSKSFSGNSQPLTPSPLNHQNILNSNKVNYHLQKNNSRSQSAGLIKKYFIIIIKFVKSKF